VDRTLRLIQHNWVDLGYNFNTLIFGANNWRVKYRCISAYHSITVLSLLLPYIIILSLHLLSTNHKCTQPCYFPLLLKPVAQKEKMDWSYSTNSSRLRVTLIVVPVELWSLPLFCFVESHHSL
jgi:hypothetical protein